MHPCSVAMPATCTTLFPYTTLFRSDEGLLALLFDGVRHQLLDDGRRDDQHAVGIADDHVAGLHRCAAAGDGERSEEHTSELQSRPHLVCRLLLEKKNTALSRTIPYS